MAKLTKQSLTEKLQRILERLDSNAKKNFSTSQTANNEFDRIADRVADLLDKVIAQGTPIY